MSCEINFKETAVQRRSQRPNSGNHPAPLPPLPETPDAHAVSGSLNISFLGARVLVTSRRLSLRRPWTNRPLGRSCGHFAKSPFFILISLQVWKWVWLSAAVGRPSPSQHSSLVQCVWPRAPRRVSLSDKYNQGHPLAPSPRPVGAWQSPHNNSVLMVLLSQGGGGGGELRASFCGLKEPLARGPGLRGWAPKIGGCGGWGGGRIGWG